MNGLERAKRDLEQAPSERRGIKSVDGVGLYAIFEALNCGPLLADEAFLSQHFDEPFLLIQQNKRLKLTSYTPAMTHFLFQPNPAHRWWATSSWSKSKRKLARMDFEWSIKEPLHQAMGRVQLSYLEKDFLPSFWAGVRCIVDKLDADLITHSLRTMEFDICKLALDHLQVDSNSFRDLLLTIHRILTVSPNDFWDALKLTTAGVWIEQFVNSPALERLLRSMYDVDDEELLQDLFKWAPLFVTTLRPLQQASACKGLVNQLFGRFQDERYPVKVNTHCYQIGAEILVSSLKDLTTDRIASNTRVAIKEVLDIVTRHIPRISGLAMRRSSPVAQLSIQLVRQALTLESQCLICDRDLLADGRSLQPGSCVVHLDIWRHSVNALTGSSITQGTQALLGAKGLVGLEKFVVPPLHKDTSGPLVQFNDALDTLNGYVSDMLEITNDSDPSEVQAIFNTNEGAIAFVGQLNSCDFGVRSAAVEVLKTATGQTVRKEAIGDALSSHFTEILDAYSLSLRRIHYLATFAPAPNMLNMCKDMLEVLCDSSKGLLRVGTMSDSGIKATENFWESIWLELGTLFTSTEAWANSGHDKIMMMKFCGDVMEFAGILFDHFPVFSSALTSSMEPKSRPRSAGKRLTDQPKTTIAAMIRFLRLRDDFLLSKSTALVCDVLRRLKEFDTAVDEAALASLEQMIKGEVRTVLSPNQKAELHSALEKHLGRAVIIRKESPVSETASKKSLMTATIDLEKWKAKAGADGRPEDLDSVIKASSRSADAFKAQQAARAQEKLPFLSKPKPLIAERKEVNAYRIAKERQEAAAAKKKRDAEAIARMRAGLNPNSVDGLTAQQGSGIAGLGISGKDHTAPRGAGMMVSSDESEDDESEDELDRELFGGKKVHKNMDEVRRANEERARKREQMRPKGPVKKQRLVRSAKDMRARIAPDLAPLHKTLLGWDFNHDGPFPPKANRQDYAAVLSTFRDPLDYQNTFQPLLTLEAWNGFLKAKEESTARPFEIKVVNRSSVDAFNEISASIEHKDAKEIGEGDIVLLSKSPTMTSRGTQDAHCLSRVMRVSRKKTHVEFLGRILPGNPMVQALGPNAKVFGLKIMSVVPLEREYGALLGLQYYDLCDEITKARPSPLLNYADDRLQPFMNKYNLNKAQSKAIKSALDNDAFTLIQGPPGSGKTKTIVAIVGALLTETLKQPGMPSVLPRSEFIANRPPSKKLLVCAPSNAAVDELVMRFKEGIIITSGERRKVGVVRLGRSDAINTHVADVTLDALVNKRLNIVPEGSAKEDTQKVMREHQDVSAKLRDARAKLDATDNAQNRKDVEDLRRQKAVLSSKVDTAKDNEGMQNRQVDLNRRKAQQDIIEESQIICATLSGSGHDMFQNLNVEFETVIIDEAAQCVELSALVPLKYGCAKCVLVGDPQQLPPTVFSKEAANFKYEQSLFVRMQSNHPQAVHLLDTQYRMHPCISAFPSKAFYDGRLLDGKDMANLRARAWHAAELLGPFQFFDIQGQHSSAPRGHSLVNHAEVRVAMQLYTRLTNDFPRQNFRGKVGIITPYKSQLRELKEQFGRQFGPGITEDVEFNTTDAFQGRESEIIIFSCVRASPSGGIGFLQDIRRMNVGLTRAKSSLWVLGNSQSLMKGEYWRKLVEHSQSSGSFFNGDVEAVLARPLKIIRKIEGLAPDEEGTNTPMPQAPRRPSSALSTKTNGSSSTRPIPAKQPMNQSNGTNGATARPPTTSSIGVASTNPHKRKLSDGASLKPSAERTNGKSSRSAATTSSSSSSSSSSDDDSDSDIDMLDAPPPTNANGKTENTAKAPQTAAAAGNGQTSTPRSVTGPGADPMASTAGMVKQPVVKKRKKEPGSIFMKRK